MPHLRFRALITLDPAEARPGVPLRLAAEEYPNRTRAVVTITLTGDDASECQDAGQRFALWCAGGVGSGVISRRVPGYPPS